MKLEKVIDSTINEYLNETNSIKVFRGHDKKFGLSIKNAKWKALYFTTDYNFASGFGNVNTYYLTPAKLLDLTSTLIRKKTFNELSDKHVDVDYDKIETIYKNGDFPFRQTDNKGFDFRLIDLILKYAGEQGYDCIKMIENFSQTITPTIYVVLDENIVGNNK